MRKKHTLVIGGSKGIGRSLVQILSSEGNAVSVISRNIPKNKVAKQVSYWPADLTDSNALSNALTQIIKQNGHIDELAFFQRYRGENNDWDGEIDTSLSSTKNVIDLLSNKFHKNASIVLISSVNASLISEHLPLAYHVAKSGLVQIARYYAMKLGPKGIRVNSVSPGTILKEESKDFLLQDQNLKRFYDNVAPLRRMGTAQEVAQVVTFLLSQKSSLITGQDIIVDGGVSLEWQEALSSRLARVKNRVSKD